MHRTVINMHQLCIWDVCVRIDVWLTLNTGQRYNYTIAICQRRTQCLLQKHRDLTDVCLRCTTNAPLIGGTGCGWAPSIELSCTLNIFTSSPSDALVVLLWYAWNQFAVHQKLFKRHQKLHISSPSECTWVSLRSSRYTLDAFEIVRSQTLIAW